MLQLERQNQLLQWLQHKGFLSTIDVAKHFGVSQMTIWRDIESLEEQGLVKRVHGGLAIPDWELGGQDDLLESGSAGTHHGYPSGGLQDPGGSLG